MEARGRLSNSPKLQQEFEILFASGRPFFDEFGQRLESFEQFLAAFRRTGKIYGPPPPNTTLKTS